MKGLNALRSGAPDPASRPASTNSASTEPGGFSSVLAAQSNPPAAAAAKDASGQGQGGSSPDQQAGPNTTDSNTLQSADGTSARVATASGSCDSGNASTAAPTALSALLALRAAGGIPPGLSGPRGSGAAGTAEAQAGAGGHSRAVRHEKAHKADAASATASGAGLLAAMVRAELANTGTGGSLARPSAASAKQAAHAPGAAGAIIGAAGISASNQITARLAMSASAGPFGEQRTGEALGNRLAAAGEPASFAAASSAAASVTGHATSPANRRSAARDTGANAGGGPSDTTQLSGALASSSANAATASTPSPGLALDNTSAPKGPSAAGAAPTIDQGAKADASGPSTAGQIPPRSQGPSLSVLGAFGLPAAPPHGAVAAGVRSPGVPSPASHQLPGVSSQLVSVLNPLRVSPGGTQSITLVLHPEALGDVRATVTATGNEVVVRLAASTTAGTEALRAALPSLHSDLRDVHQRAVVVLADARHDNAFGGAFGHQNSPDYEQAARTSTSRLAPSTTPGAAPTSGEGAAASAASNRLLDVRI